MVGRFELQHPWAALASWTVGRFLERQHPWAAFWMAAWRWNPEALPALCLEAKPFDLCHWCSASVVDRWLTTVSRTSCSTRSWAKTQSVASHREDRLGRESSSPSQNLRLRRRWRPLTDVSSHEASKVKLQKTDRLTLGRESSYPLAGHLRFGGRLGLTPWGGKAATVLRSSG